MPQVGMDSRATLRAAQHAGVLRRIAAMLYEALVIAAILFIAALLFHGAAVERLAGASRVILQVYLVTVLGAYFVWFWQRGQTLPMKAWRLRLTLRNGAKVPAARALARYLVAAITIGTTFAAGLYLREHPESLVAWFALAPGVLSVGWALADPDRQCLYDWIAGTRLVVAEKPPAP
ncbi:MAG: RDD family protein [Burkholderiales bacterium]